MALQIEADLLRAALKRIASSLNPETVRLEAVKASLLPLLWLEWLENTLVGNFMCFESGLVCANDIPLQGAPFSRVLLRLDERACSEVGVRRVWRTLSNRLD